MNSIAFALRLFVCLLALAPGQQARAQDGTRGELGWLRDLAGHCWHGTQADGAPADTQCYELQFGRHLRGTIELPGAAGEPPRLRGDSVWSWDAARQKITVVAWANVGALGVNEAAFDGELVRFTFGPNMRSYWQRTGPDSFVVVREVRDAQGWREDRRVTYQRVASPR